MSDRSPPNSKPPRSDSAQAVRFLVIKAAIFILVPLAAAGLAVAFLMPK
ncbi:MAG TPA: phosphoribosylformylglycinamidine synthase-associated small membrane protein [Hyphomicrobium sp.]|nr:phosphoribosylformylglycinamidine synthase-associated small membrane protein [Hyphomicrobium sp.]